MPIGFLTDAERERLDSFPTQVVPGDLDTYFTLSRSDRRQIPRTTSSANRLGFALQLGALRFLGFCPDDLSTVPETVVAYVARQLDVAPSELARYGRRGQTRTEHLRQIRCYLGFRKPTAGDLAQLENWLSDRALEHDRPTLLLRLACEHLLSLRIERPGITHLERVVASARWRAQQETYRRLAPILTGDCKARLDGLLTINAATGRSNLAWLQQSAATYTPPMILATLEKRACCRRWGVDQWNVLIPREGWPGLRTEVCREIQAPEDGTDRLREREQELSGLLDRVETLLAKGGDVRMEGNDLVVSPLEAQQKPESTAELERLIDERLPLVELSELLIEVDGWTRFSDDFEHAGGTEPRSREVRNHLYATVLAQACNLGLTRMARISDLTYQKLAWCTNWYIREETLKAATTRLVNETELPLLEHTTDSAGYTEVVFAQFDLLGLRFSPRIRDLGDQRLFRVERQKRHPHLGPLLKGRINRDRILRNWDDLLRVAGSLKRGWVTASLLIGKLQSYPRKNQLTRALQEYGRLVKTIFILRYLESEPLRRRINTQLNKGEALHGLREFLLFANKGVLRKKQEEELTNQAGCLNLVTNAVVTWNTVYMAAVIDRLRAEGKTVNEEDIARLSPARYEHINPYGKYRFEAEEGLSRSRLRPLRQPTDQQSR